MLTVTYYLNLWYILRALNGEWFLAAYRPLRDRGLDRQRRRLFIAALAEGYRMTLVAPEPLPLPCRETDGELGESPRVTEAGAVPMSVAVARAKPVAAKAAVAKTAVAKPAVAKAAVAKSGDSARQGTGERRRSRRAGSRCRSGRSSAGAPRYKITRRDLALALLLVVIAGGLRFWRLEQPNELVFDEVYFVEQGKNYLRGKEFMDPHPPFAKLAIGASVALFGGEASGYRIFNAVCGTLPRRRRVSQRPEALGRRARALRHGGGGGVRRSLHRRLENRGHRHLVRHVRRALVPAAVSVPAHAAGRTSARDPHLPRHRARSEPREQALHPRLHVDDGGVLPRRDLGARRTAASQRAAVGTRHRAGGARHVRGTAMYLAVFLPHYWLGWWHSIWDIPKYFKDVVGYEARRRRCDPSLLVQVVHLAVLAASGVVPLQRRA